jgi:hypothetical protein
LWVTVTTLAVSFEVSVRFSPPDAGVSETWPDTPARHASKRMLAAVPVTPTTQGPLLTPEGGQGIPASASSSAAGAPPASSGDDGDADPAGVTEPHAKKSSANAGERSGARERAVRACPREGLRARGRGARAEETPR